MAHACKIGVILVKSKQLIITVYYLSYQIVITN